MFVEYDQPKELWRYDLEEPDNFWNPNYHSLEYTYPTESSELRYKNRISAYFFYDNEKQVIETAKNAITNRGLSDFWITNTRLNPNIRLLDLRFGQLEKGKVCTYDDPILIIDRLYELGLDVLTEEYNRYDSLNGDKTPFSVWKNNYTLYKELQNLNNSEDEEAIRSTLRSDLNEFFRNPAIPSNTCLGEILTDFENGIHFKKFLKRINCAGYIFQEEPSGTSTYCILESNCLEEPKNRIYKNTI